MKKTSELSLDELIKMNVRLKGFLIVFLVLGLIAGILLIWLKAKPVLFVPVMILPVMALPILISLKTVNDEIKSRNSNKPSNV